MHCCGTHGLVIELGAGPEPLALVRCPSCGRRQWRLGGQGIRPDAAFAALGARYRALPRQARAARERAASTTAARAAARVAAAGASPTVTLAPAEAGPAPVAARTVDRDGLAALLQGWSVLGAAG